MAARLPGLQPVADGDWLRVDDAYAAQMAYRDRLIATRRRGVVSEPTGICDAERDLLDAVLAEAGRRGDYAARPPIVLRPDGVAIDLGGDRPLVCAARLAQEDFLILEPTSDGYRLTSAVLCFPASWTLAQKIGRDVASIHMPVDRYDDQMARRVDRVITALQPGKAVWRANVLCYNDPELHQPRLEHERRPFDPDGPLYVRVERQTLLKLAPSGAVVFGIHTYLVPMERLTPDQLASLPDNVRRGGSMGESN